MTVQAKKIYRLLTMADKMLVAVLVLLSAASFLLAGLTAKSGEYALISVHGQPALRKPLHRDDLFIVTGAAGRAVIEIREGSIRVLDSDCPQKFCVRQGRIHRVGEIVVCVPNKITVWIEGQRPNPFDAVTG